MPSPPMNICRCKPVRLNIHIYIYIYNYILYRNRSIRASLLWTRSLITMLSAPSIDSRVVIYKTITIQGMNDTPVPVAAHERHSRPQVKLELKPTKQNSTWIDCRLSEVIGRHYKSLYQILVKVKVIAYLQHVIRVDEPLAIAENCALGTWKVQ